MPWLCEQTGSLRQQTGLALTKRGLSITWTVPILPFAPSTSSGPAPYSIRGQTDVLSTDGVPLPFVLSLPVLSMSKGRSMNGRVRVYYGSFNATPRSLDKLRNCLGDHGANGMTAHDCTCANTLRGESKRPGVFPEQVLCLGSKHGDRPCTQEARWQIYRLVASSDGEEGAHERNTYG